MTRVKSERQRQAIVQRRASMFSTVFLILCCIITLFPIYYVFLNAFKTINGIYTNPMGFSLDTFTTANFAAAVERLHYWRALMNSVFYTAFAVVIVVVVGALAGFGIGISRGKGIRAIYLGIVALVTVPFQLYMIPLVIEMRLMGLVGTYLGPALVFGVTGTTFTIFVYTSFMKSVPYELYEAAAVDGASPLRILISVYLPLLQAVTVTIVIIRSLAVWNGGLIPLVTIFDQQKYNLILELKVLAGSVMIEWDLVFAGTVLITIPMTLLFVFLQRYFMQGVTAGSVKG